MPSSPSSASALTESPGRVVSGHGRRLVVEAPDASRTLCHTRGKKSEAVVGDRVDWQVSGDEGVIDRILPRTNLLYRQDDFKTKAFAANIDQLLVVVAAEPVFSESQLARALIAAGEAHVPARIVLNKRDLPAFDAANERLAPYVAMGVEVLDMALKKEPDDSRARLAPLLADRATLVLGPSGAGKSTLVNLRVANAKAQIGEISQSLNTGRHTTTATQWYSSRRFVATISSGSSPRRIPAFPTSPPLLWSRFRGTAAGSSRQRHLSSAFASFVRGSASC